MQPRDRENVACPRARVTLTNFRFELDFEGPLSGNGVYGNDDLLEIRYDVRGSLETDPPTPSGFAAFALNRFASGEGPISPAEYSSSGNSVSISGLTASWKNSSLNSMPGIYSVIQIPG